MVLRLRKGRRKPYVAFIKRKVGISVKKIAIVTGASSGMGREFVSYIDKNLKSIDEIWIIARRINLLEEVKNNTNKNCIIIQKDVCDDELCVFLQRKLKFEKAGIKLLINCAGFGIMGSFIDTERSLSVGMVNTNCSALTGITSACIPYMLKNSRIINLASSAAFLPQPDFAVYAATKSYVLSLSRALGYELQNKEIYVTAVCPGPVDTAFFDIAEAGRKRPWFKDLFMADPKEVVEKAMIDAFKRKKVSVYGNSMKTFRLLTKIVPHKLILDIYSLGQAFKDTEAGIDEIKKNQKR